MTSPLIYHVRFDLDDSTTIEADATSGLYLSFGDDPEDNAVDNGAEVVIYADTPEAWARLAAEALVAANALRVPGGAA